MFDSKNPEAGNSLAAQAGPLIDRTADKASAMAHRGLDAVIEGTDQLRAKAQHASDSTVDYIRNEPVKAMLMAAPAGAALTALISLLGRSRA